MKEYTKRTNIHPCVLEKSDLLNIEELIRSDVETKRVDDFKVNSNLQNVSIYENSVYDFLKNKNLPKILSRLSMSIIGWSKDYNIDKSINLTFYDNFISLSVSGVSETWVNGKYLQIKDFLITKRPALWFLKTTPVYMLRGMLFTISFLGSGFLIMKFVSGEFKSVGILLPAMLFIIPLFDIVLSKFRYVQIYIEEKKSFIEKYNSWIVILGAIGSVISIIAFIFGVLKK